MFSSIHRSIELVQTSWNVLKKDKEMLLFPVLSTIASIIFLSLFLFPMVITKAVPDMIEQEPILFYVSLFIIYLVTSFIVIFFNTALISCAHIRLSGGNPTFSDGISNALRHINRIATWALISATIGLVLNFLRDNSNAIVRLIIDMIGIAWNLLTFFVIPVMIFEEKGVIASIKDSATLFKKTWGETVVGQGSISLIFFLAGLLLIIPVILAGLSGDSELIIPVLIIVIPIIIILAVIASALKGIFNTALYIYASTGRVPEVYQPELITGAFQPKR